MKYLTFIAVLFGLFGCATCEWSNMKSDSPKGGYVAIIEEVERHVGIPRDLSIKKKIDMSQIFSMPVERNATAIWSPDESTVAILDDYASNENRVIAVGLPDGKRLVEACRSNLVKYDSKFDGTKYSHVYFHNLQWKKGGLLADVYMYDRLTESVPTSCHRNIEIRCSEKE